MKFTATQHFTFPAARTAEAFIDRSLYPWFAKLPKVHTPPEVLDRVVAADGIVTLRIRYRFGGDLSSAARALIDPAKLTWVDESVHDPATRSTHFVLHPDNYATQFRCRGRYTIVDTDDGCRRDAEVEVKVRMPIVGRAVEGAIASGLREHLDDEVAIIEAFMAAQDEGGR